MKKTSIIATLILTSLNTLQARELLPLESANVCEIVTRNFKSSPSTFQDTVSLEFLTQSKTLNNGFNSQQKYVDLKIIDSQTGDSIQHNSYTVVAPDCKGENKPCKLYNMSYSRMLTHNMLEVSAYASSLPFRDHKDKKSNSFTQDFRAGRETTDLTYMNCYNTETLSQSFWQGHAHLAYLSIVKSEKFAQAISERIGNTEGVAPKLWINNVRHRTQYNELTHIEEGLVKDFNLQIALTTPVNSDVIAANHNTIIYKPFGTLSVSFRAKRNSMDEPWNFDKVNNYKWE